MKVQSNSAGEMLQFFKKDLGGLYDAEELNNLAWYTFEHVLGFDRSDLVLKQQETMSESQMLKFFGIIKRLKKQEPIQYVLGNTEFYGLQFKVNPAVLIPRPETEELVHWVLNDHKESKNQSLIDIGTGSGCIAIALKKNVPNWNVTALDVSKEAIEVAKENCKLNKCDVNFICESIAGYKCDTTYDIIVSNPPYVTNEQAKEMAKNVLDNEPHLALFAPGNDPFYFYKAILFFANDCLKDNGLVYFEINEIYGDDMKALLSASNYHEIELRKDLRGVNRMIKARKK